MPTRRVLPNSSRMPRNNLARILVRPPTRASKGAQAINDMLGTKSKLSRRNPVPRQYRVVINWGNSTALSHNAGVTVLNPPSAVAIATNKLRAFTALKAAGVRVPDFSTETPADGLWLARTMLCGSQGRGIAVVRARDENKPSAPLYTKYIKKTTEVRVHVAFGQAIFLQYKKRQTGADQTADQKLIRNHANGWVFCPRDLDEAPHGSTELAVEAVQALGLHFGAVDIVIGKQDGLPYVLEVNTAPGIESPTLAEAYKTAFQRRLL